MKKSLLLGSLMMLGATTLSAQQHTAPNMADPAIAVSVVPQWSDELPTSQWSDLADTSWYNAANDEFNISTEQQLAGLSLLVSQGNTFVGKTIHLLNDLNLIGHLWTPIGFNNNNPFSGTFDGAEFQIHNMIVNRPGGDFLGLFGQTNNATIRNTKMTNAIVQGNDTAGTIAGNLFQNGLIENCHSIGHSVLITGYNGGGLVGGALTNSEIRRCSADGSVVGVNQIGGLVGTLWDKTEVHESYSAGTVSGEYIIGGFAGFSTMAFGPDRANKVFNSYSRSNVFATMFRAGGFFGAPEFLAEMHNCYSTGTVSVVEDAGAFIGTINDGIVDNCHYDMESNDLPAIGNQNPTPANFDVTGQTTEYMQSQVFADQLNTDSENLVWNYHPDINDGYPNLNLEEHMSVTEPVALSRVAIYPTLVQDSFLIQAENSGNKYQIFDVNGRLVAQGVTSTAAHSVSASRLVPGAYFVQIFVDGKSQTIKILKK